MPLIHDPYVFDGQLSAAGRVLRGGGLPWVHLPEKYGNRRGVYNRLRMWALDGTWERVFATLMAQVDADEDLNWAVSVGSTIVRVHQHAAGAK